MPRKMPHLHPTNRVLKRSFLAFLLSSLGFLGGCANVIPPCGAKISPPSSELRNTRWELTRWNLPPNNKGEVRARQIPQGEASNPIQIVFEDRKSTRLNSSHMSESRMPSSA